MRRTHPARRGGNSGQSIGRSGSRSVFIVGAGFSSYTGTPLQSEFTQALLAAREFGEGSASHALVKFLSRFVHHSFDHLRSAQARFWPELEDIFTCVDLSANTGHHLGPKYPPALLRTVRRALLARIVRMLRHAYAEAKRAEGKPWRQLDQLLGTINPSRTAFISMNWDTALEDRVCDIYADALIDYGDAVRPAQFPEAGNTIADNPQLGVRRIRIIKMHGSINWLYCDNCRQVFWFPSDQVGKIAGQLLREQEWSIIDPSHRSGGPQWHCHKCQGVPLSTRIATFSYRKALEFPMFQKSWFEAEELLREATTWVFIGYSLPPADYEFKYLLKRVELSRRARPRFVVITGGQREAAETTRRNYQKFFGRSIRRGENVFMSGLTREAIGYLKRTL